MFGDIHAIDRSGSLGLDLLHADFGHRSTYRFLGPWRSWFLLFYLSKFLAFQSCYFLFLKAWKLVDITFLSIVSSHWPAISHSFFVSFSMDPVLRVRHLENFFYPHFFLLIFLYLCICFCVYLFITLSSHLSPVILLVGRYGSAQKSVSFHLIVRFSYCFCIKIFPVSDDITMVHSSPISRCCPFESTRDGIRGWITEQELGQRNGNGKCAWSWWIQRRVVAGVSPGCRPVINACLYISTVIFNRGI